MPIFGVLKKALSLEVSLKWRMKREKRGIRERERERERERDR
jgi:hypothetical protein